MYSETHTSNDGGLPAPGATGVTGKDNSGGTALEYGFADLGRE